LNKAITQVFAQGSQKNYEASNLLPEGWCWATLSDLVEDPKSDIVDGPFGSNLKASEYTDKGVPIVRIQNVDRSRFVDKNIRFISNQKAKELKRHNFHPGDIVLTKLGDPLGKACLVPNNFGPGIIVADIVRLRLGHDLCSIPYLSYCINSGPAIEQIIKHVKGTTRPRVNLGHIRALRIPLAPLPEQKCIVANVEKLMSRVNAVRERLAKVQEILKRFRQSVLAAAYSGRLTVDWRVENPNLESAERLFKRVCIKRKEKYKEECKKAKEEGKKIPKKPASIGPRKVDDNELPEIPEGWIWVYLPDFGYMNRGKSRHRPRNASHLYDGPYPFIQTGDIAQSGGRITSHRQTYSKAGLAQSKIWPAKTICITIAANIASSAILTYPACFPDSVVGVIPDPELCHSEYLEYFIRTAQADLDQFAPATSQKNINIGILNDVAVPLPPYLEQQEIVHWAESLLKLADAIEKRVSAASARAKKMTQAILAKAFRGELVPTEAELARKEDRSYESASDLLAKIKAQRKDVKPRREGIGIRQRKR